MSRPNARAVAARAVVAALAVATAPLPAAEEPVAPRWHAAEAAAPEAVAIELQRVCATLRASDDPYYGTLQTSRLRQQLLVTSEVEARLAIEEQLALQTLRLGEPPREAVVRLNQALRDAARLGVSRRRQVELLYQLGVALLRTGEVENCVEHHTAAMCIFPIVEAGRHVRDRAARDAMAAFRQVLAAAPGHHQARWLLAVAAMTVGEYPAAVPPPLRLPAAALTSEHPLPRFENVALATGLDAWGTSGGALVEDFDGDGRLDVVLSHAGGCSPMRFFHNDGRGGFEDRSDVSGLSRQLGGLQLLHADYDEDGDLDILVLRGGWMARHGRIRNSLLRNRGDGTFEDVTVDAGLAWPAWPTQTGAWADYDGDGDLDLYIGNEGGPEGGYPSQLFRSEVRQGRERFTDVAVAAGVAAADTVTKGVAWGDYDDDGDPDLYLSNLGANHLYRNRGDGTFEDVAEALGVDAPRGQSFATWFFDVDNDGDLDLFVADYSATTAEVAAWLVAREPSPRHPLLYLNDGKGGFTEVSEAFGLTAPSQPMGASFGDLDNDGFLDVYLGTGDPSFDTLVPNLMYRNDAGRGFVDVTVAGGFGHLQKGHGVAFADLDGDGDEDVVEQMGGAYPGDVYATALYENPHLDARRDADPTAAGRGWIALRLVGRESNRSAIGARVTAWVRDREGDLASRHRVVGSGSSFGGNPLAVHLGLGDADELERLEIRWPSGRVDRFGALAGGRPWRIEEGGEPVAVASPPIPFRTSSAPQAHPHRPPESRPGDEDPPPRR